MNLLAEAAGAPPVRRRAPYRVAYAAAFAFEAKGRLLRQSRPPWVTRYATWLLGRNLEYSTEKARRQLGWSPGLTYAESIDRTVRWLDEHERSTGGAAPSFGNAAAGPGTRDPAHVRSGE
jgi:nucleoside-diphosphate-sugar epimerase